MAKIDTSLIEGYEDMTPEEKLEALETFEYEDNAEEMAKLKKAATKANKEAADWKRKHKALEEAGDHTDELDSLKNEVADLKREKLIAKNTAKFLSLGYEKGIAEEAAEAMAEGDTEKVFELQEKAQKAHDKEFEKELLKKTPKPGPGEPDKPMTLETLRKMNANERYKFSQEHPEEYKNLYGGNT